MKIKQWIFILLAMIGVVALFGFGNIVKPKKVSTAMQPADDHEHTPMMSPLANVTPVDINTLTTSYKKKLKPELMATIDGLEKVVTTARSDADKAVALDNVGRFWHEQKIRVLAAYNVGKSGLLDNSEKKLTFASHLMSEDIQQETDPAVRKMMFNVADECLKKLIALDPKNQDARIDHGLMIINGSGEVMTGVGVLLDVVDKNPKNLRAQIVLTEMAIQSQQFDKAIERADKIIGLDAKNLQAYLMKSEALARSGKKEEAISVLNAAKKMMNNPNFDKDVDKYIEENLK